MGLGIQSASIGGAAKNLVVATDPSGNIAAAHVSVNSSGVETGIASNPFAVSISNLPVIQAVSMASAPLPAGAAQDGSDATGITAPAGANGIRGWLSGIYGRLSSTLPVSLATLPALPAGTATIGSVNVLGTVPVTGNFYQATQPVSLAVALPSGTNTLGSVTGSGTFTVAGQGAVAAAPTSAPVSIAGVDGAGNKQHFRTDALGVPADAAWSSGSGSLVALGKAMVAAQQATTAAVTSSSLVPPSPNFVQTTAMASNLVLKSGPGSLYACYVTVGSTPGWLMLLDAVAVPSNGAIAPKNCIYCPANATTEIELPFLTAEPFSTGITAVFSSTGPFTLTASSTVFIKGIVQ